MSSNNTGKNIVKAFKIVYNTYENVNKLMSYLQNQARERKKYNPCSDRFLRWNSDQNTNAWAYSSFILVFQDTNDIEMKNGWYDGPLYVLEINFFEYEEATVNIARFDFFNINNLEPRLSPSHHWVFYDPLYGSENIIDYTGDEKNYDGTIKNETISKRYWGLQRVVGFSLPLTDINAENAYDKVFGGFDSLAGQ